MRPFLAAFSDELMKVGAANPALIRQSVLSSDGDDTVDRIVSSSTSHGKNYARSIAFGAVIAPVMTVLSRSLGRFVHNRSVMKAVANAVGRQSKRKLTKELKTGPLLGRSFGHKLNRAPVMSYADLGSDVFSGVAGGSIVQALRHRFGPSYQD